MPTPDKADLIEQMLATERQRAEGLQATGASEAVGLRPNVDPPDQATAPVVPGPLGCYPSVPNGGDSGQLETLRAFARFVLNGYEDGEVGDLDGAWLEEKALELGLLVKVGGDEPLYGLAPFLSSAPARAEEGESPYVRELVANASAWLSQFFDAQVRGHQPTNWESNAETLITQLLICVESALPVRAEGATTDEQETTTEGETRQSPASLSGGQDLRDGAGKGSKR